MASSHGVLNPLVGIKGNITREGREKGSLTNNGFHPLLLIGKDPLFRFNGLKSGVEDSISYLQLLVH